MPDLQPRRLFIATVIVAAPGFLVLGGLAAAGVLASTPAVAGGAALLFLAGALAWGHVSDLERLRLRIDRMATHGEDPKYEASTVTELALAVGRLGRRWQEERDRLTVESATADRVLEALPDPLIVVDGDRQVVRANHAAEEAFQTALAGRDLAAALRHPLLLRAVDSAIGEGHSLAEEIVMPAPTNRNYSAIVKPLGEGGEAGALALLHDLTPIRLGEQMRADFVANVSHELRTPLSSLLGFVETLRGPARQDPEAHENFLAIMHEQAERMSRLIEDLLSLSRIEMEEHSRPRVPVDMRLVLAKVEDMLTMKARKRGMRIVTSTPSDLTAVPGDADQLTQVFQNLVDNAIKYGRDDSPVEIDVVQSEADEIAVTVTDYGEGIPREHLPRLTERFYRVDAARSRQLGGTGLGLAIVKHIVNRHRGRLDVASEVGKGSDFTVFLPTEIQRQTSTDAPSAGAAAT